MRCAIALCTVLRLDALAALMGLRILNNDEMLRRRHARMEFVARRRRLSEAALDTGGYLSADTVRSDLRLRLNAQWTPS